MVFARQQLHAGHVGIGTTSPAGLLDVYNGSGTHVITALANGNVGIGITNPGQALHVNGYSNFGDATNYGQIRHSGSAGNFHLDTYGTGKMYLNWYSGTGGVAVGNGATNYGPIAASAFNVSSDRRLKTDITPIDDALDRILQISAYNFRYKSEPNGPMQVGLMAQEVEKVYPEVVSFNDKGFRQVNYSGLVGPIIAAVKNLKKQQDQGLAEAKSDTDDKFNALIARLVESEKENKSLEAGLEAAKSESAQLKSFLCKQFPDTEFCR